MVLCSVNEVVRLPELIGRATKQGPRLRAARAKSRIHGGHPDAVDHVRAVEHARDGLADHRRNRDDGVANPAVPGCSRS